jgi:hypothetical protein
MGGRLLLENTIVVSSYIYISQGVVALGYKPVKSYNLDTQSEEPYPSSCTTMISGRPVETWVKISKTPTGCQWVRLTQILSYRTKRQKVFSLYQYWAGLGQVPGHSEPAAPTSTHQLAILSTGWMG